MGNLFSLNVYLAREKRERTSLVFQPQHELTIPDKGRELAANVTLSVQSAMITLTHAQNAKQTKTETGFSIMTAIKQ